MHMMHLSVLFLKCRFKIKNVTQPPQKKKNAHHATAVVCISLHIKQSRLTVCGLFRKKTIKLCTNIRISRRFAGRLEFQTYCEIAFSRHPGPGAIYQKKKISLTTVIYDFCISFFVLFFFCPVK